ncbi:hypothetical protein GGI42DRAFT_207734 [Trichoderma sp. SZMC 28013]
MYPNKQQANHLFRSQSCMQYAPQNLALSVRTCICRNIPKRQINAIHGQFVTPNKPLNLPKTTTTSQSLSCSPLKSAQRRKQADLPMPLQTIELRAGTA